MLIGPAFIAGLAGVGASLWRGRGAVRPFGVALAGGGSAASATSTAAAPPALRDAARRAVVLPPGVERASLLAELARQFVRLQAAWDRGERAALALLTTPQMLAELCIELPGRANGHDADRTDVVTLHAELLGFDEIAGAWMATVEFSGLIRESPGQGAAPFRELWMLTRPMHVHTAWRLARHQALL